MDMTMVQLRKKTVHRLKALKRYGRQSYDEVINNMLDNPDDLSADDIKEIKRGLEDIREGRIFTEAQAAQRLGIKG